MLTELMAAMEQIPDRRLLAGWVKSPTTALEHFSSHNLGGCYRETATAVWGRLETVLAANSQPETGS